MCSGAGWARSLCCFAGAAVPSCLAARDTGKGRGLLQVLLSSVASWASMEHGARALPSMLSAASSERQIIGAEPAAKLKLVWKTHCSHSRALPSSPRCLRLPSKAGARCAPAAHGTHGMLLLSRARPRTGSARGKGPALSSQRQRSSSISWKLLITTALIQRACGDSVFHQDDCQRN